MPTEPLTTADLTTIRDRADRFLAELLNEWYLHYAGHKDSLDIAEIYDRYPELTSLENATALGASVNGDRSTSAAGGSVVASSVTTAEPRLSP